MIAQRLSFPEANRVVLGEFELADEPQGRQLLLEAEYSVISAGTEGAAFTGLELEHPGARGRFKYPRPTTGYGHVAKVLAVGPEVKNVAPGDRVLTLSPHASHWLAEEDRLTLKLDPQLDGKRAVFIRMAGVGITAVRRSSVEVGDTVAVIGLGLVGNFAAQIFRLQGAEVMGLDLCPHRLEQARECGIPFVGNTGERDLVEIVNEWTDGQGAYCVVEAIGIPELILQGVQCTRRLGEIILLGSPRKMVTTAVTPMLSRIHLQGIRMIGALEWVYSIPPNPALKTSILGNYAQIQRWISDGRLQVDPLRTHVLSPAECQRAYDGLIHEKDTYTGVVFDWSLLG